MAEKYVRFVTFQKDEVTGEYLGFFNSVYELKRAQQLPSDDHERLTSLLDWFRKMLDAPGRFHRSANPHAHGKGLSWFKPSAEEHIAKARQLLDILDRHGVASQMLTSSRPGYVLYQDEFQVCAIPYREQD